MSGQTTLLIRAGTAALLLACAAGCSWWGGGSGEYATPPTVVGDEGPADRDPSGKRMVVIGHFHNPAKASVAWKDIGVGMSDALAKTLLNHGEFDVWVNDPLSRRVEKALESPFEEQAAQLGRIQREHQAVRYVVTGRVTDFHHTSQLPRELQRGKSGAIVAVQVNVVDLETQRLVVADHIYGAAAADGKSNVQRLYAGVSMNSYLFWSTPLGLASKQAIERTMARLNRLVPTSDESIRIVRHVGPRRVTLSAGATTRLKEGAEYFVCVYDETGTAIEPVVDMHTRLPLRARVEETGRLTTTAWIAGRKPLEVDLRGAVLVTRLPLPGEDAPVVATAADEAEPASEP
ncbi:MAG: CsgG/HfaB family protein [Planctomycetota bacterium]